MKNQNRKIRNVEKLRALATKLAAEELLTATNEGTYSSADAARVCGTGDPRYTTLRVYELVGGGKRYEGPVGNGMPGRLRALNQQELKQKRWELRDLRAELREELKQLSEEVAL